MTDGRTLADGRYVLSGPLGRGGMAEVHRGTDLRLDRPVAVKLLAAHLTADPTAQQRFRREAQAAARLNHPAVAAVFDTGEEPDPVTGQPVSYIVMELVEGRTLRAVLDGSGPLPPAEALRITAGVLDALAHSHAAGLIHRDIKPANIMLTASGAVKVMDFGIARAVDDPTGGLTQTATVIGTAQYLSPEQASGGSVDLRSDLYSVGCLLFELLLGRPPFVGDTVVSVAYQHVREAPVPPSSLDPRLSPAVDGVVLTALAKDPDDRYQTAGAMRAEVEGLLAAVESAETLAPATAVAAAPAPIAAGPLLDDDTATRATPVPAATPAVADPDAQEEEERRRSPARLLLVALAVFLLLGLGAVGLSRVLGPSHADAAVVTVPDLSGRTRAEAENRLRDAGLVAAFREVAGKSGKSVGRVVNQDPAAGGPVAPGTVVRLEVNAGPGKAKIPDVVGRDVDDAERALRKAGFSRVRTEPTAATGAAAAGTVVAVQPKTSKAVALDTAVVLRYARSGSTAAATQQPRSPAAPTRPRATQAPASRTPTPTASASPTPRPSARPTTATPTEPSSEPTASSTPSATRAPSGTPPAPTTTPSQG